MPLAYLLDENLRGLLGGASNRHNARGFYPMTSTCRRIIGPTIIHVPMPNLILD